MNLLKNSLLSLVAALAASTASHAQTTISLNGVFRVSYFDSPILTQDPSSALAGTLYYGVGHLTYDFEIDGSIDLHEPYFWTLEASANGPYYYQLDGEPAVSQLFDIATGPIDLNGILTGGAPFSVADATYGLFGLSPTDALAAVSAFFSGLPNPGDFTDIYDALGLPGPAPAELSSLLYFQASPFPNGEIDFALTEPVDGFEGFALSAFFDIKLTLVPVPEPSTYGLIGAGALVVLIGARRFRARKPPANA